MLVDKFSEKTFLVELKKGEVRSKHIAGLHETLPEGKYDIFINGIPYIKEITLTKDDLIENIKNRNPNSFLITTAGLYGKVYKNKERVAA
ncbi:MAG: hypothetical protein KKF48_01730 [Nanoarchaeota archaeon]|nr:hypothetical protein [Nanoarchaeota archaeon]MBU1027741.1 hypothetical protein [Nanoarchaeota archaeon]